MEAETSPNVELFEIVLDLMKTLKRYTTMVGEDYGLSMPQIHLIWSLGEGKPLSMGQVAEGMNCDPSNVTGIVHRLEEMQLIERVASSDDRRIKTLSLTDKGERVRIELAERVGRELPMTNALTDDERSVLKALLKKAIATTVL